MTEHRRSWDNLLPFLIGLIIGVLTSFASFSGRVSALEATTANHTRELEGIGVKLDRLSDAINRIAERIPVKKSE